MRVRLALTFVVTARSPGGLLSVLSCCWLSSIRSSVFTCQSIAFSAFCTEQKEGIGEGLRQRRRIAPRLIRNVIRFVLHTSAPKMLATVKCEGLPLKSQRIAYMSGLVLKL